MPPHAKKLPTRREQSFAVRHAAATLAASRPHETHLHNHDEHRFLFNNNTLNLYVACFTKGLPHDRDTGLLHNPEHYRLFVHASYTSAYEDIRAIPLGPPHPSGRLYRSGISRTPAVPVRAWESMAAGLTFDLQGPDSQATSMPPAPSLTSAEMAFEMSELYWMALLRDVPFTYFDTSRLVHHAVRSLNAKCWVRCARCPRPSKHLSYDQRKRLRGPFCSRSVFRGKLPGDAIGPYISQFLLMGTSGVARDIDPAQGYIQYGAMRIDQRVRVAARLDYMTSWEAWLDVQNGADVRGRGSFADGNGDDGYRFITTPRDLATYVHFDALYQAYLNACLILLDMGAPFDAGLPFGKEDAVDKQQGFATFGPPHVQTLVTEVATRALKAVRFQKFNVHRRLRPEAVGGLLERHHRQPNNPLFHAVCPLYRALDKDSDKLLQRVAALNGHYNSSVRDRGWPRRMDYDPRFGKRARGGTRCGVDARARACAEDTILLPMAFPEGSPMHPSYGAGHAAVAGACVTVLKAFFDAEWQLPWAYVPTKDGRALEELNHVDLPSLTVAGELNKLCSNISIGRNWAGVHYFSDYYESVLLGEKVALGILEEQKLTYREQFLLTVPLFDGSVRRI